MLLSGRRGQRKAAEDWRTPKRCRGSLDASWFRQVLECGSPLPLWILQLFSTRPGGTSFASDMAAAKPKTTTVTCPRCGHNQREPVGVYSTICKECRAHFRLDEIATPAKRTA